MRVCIIQMSSSNDKAANLAQARRLIEQAVSDIKNPQAVAENGRKIKALEEEGDAIYHQAVGALFDGTPDALQVIKWKELYDKLEEAMDECEDVSNVLESISLKNS